MRPPAPPTSTLQSGQRRLGGPGRGRSQGLEVPQASAAITARLPAAAQGNGAVGAALLQAHHLSAVTRLAGPPPARTTSRQDVRLLPRGAAHLARSPRQWCASLPPAACFPRAASGRQLQQQDPGAETEEDHSVTEGPVGEIIRPRPQGSSPVYEYTVEGAGFGAQTMQEATEVTLNTEVEAGASGYTVTGGGDQGIFVKQVLKDSSAAKLFSLREGDQLLSATIFFDHMKYEDALKILQYSEPYKVQFRIKRKLSASKGEESAILHSQQGLKSQEKQDKDTADGYMETPTKTLEVDGDRERLISKSRDGHQRRPQDRLSWPKFQALGSKRASGPRRSHSSSEASEQRDTHEVSPTSTDTEAQLTADSQEQKSGTRRRRRKFLNLRFGMRSGQGANITEQIGREPQDRRGHAGLLEESQLQEDETQASGFTSALSTQMPTNLSHSDLEKEGPGEMVVKSDKHQRKKKQLAKQDKEKTFSQHRAEPARAEPARAEPAPGSSWDGEWEIVESLEMGIARLSLQDKPDQGSTQLALCNSKTPETGFSKKNTKETKKGSKEVGIGEKERRETVDRGREDRQVPAESQGRTGHATEKGGKDGRAGWESEQEKKDTEQVTQTGQIKVKMPKFRIPSFGWSPTKEAVTQKRERKEVSTEDNETLDEEKRREEPEKKERECKEDRQTTDKTQSRKAAQALYTESDIGDNGGENSEKEISFKMTKLKEPSFCEYPPGKNGTQASMVVQTCNMEAEVSLPSVQGELQTPDLSIHLPSSNLEVKAGQVDVKIADVQLPEGEQIAQDADGASLKGHLPNLQMPSFKMPKVDLKGPTVDVKGPTVDAKGPTVDVKSPKAEISGPDMGVSLPGVKVDIQAQASGRQLQQQDPGAETEEDHSVTEGPVGEIIRPRPQGSSPVYEYTVEGAGFGAQTMQEATEVTLNTEVEAGASGYTVTGGGDQGIFVKQVLKDSSAAKLFSLREGDQLLSATIFFDHMKYEDALKILQYSEPYKVQFRIKRKLSASKGEESAILHSQQGLKSQEKQDKDTADGYMETPTKTLEVDGDRERLISKSRDGHQRRPQDRLSWPKFQALGSKRASGPRRSHSSSEASEQRDTHEVSPTSTDTEAQLTADSQEQKSGTRRRRRKFLNLRFGMRSGQGANITEQIGREPQDRRGHAGLLEESQLQEDETQASGFTSALSTQMPTNLSHSDLEKEGPGEMVVKSDKHQRKKKQLAKQDKEKTFSQHRAEPARAEPARAEPAPGSSWDGEWEIVESLEMGIARLSLQDKPDQGSTQLALCNSKTPETGFSKKNTKETKKGSKEVGIGEKERRETVDRGREDRQVPAESQGRTGHATEKGGKDGRAGWESEQEKKDTEQVTQTGQIKVKMPKFRIPSFGWSPTKEAVTQKRERKEVSTEDNETLDEEKRREEPEKKERECKEDRQTTDKTQSRKAAQALYTESDIGDNGGENSEKEISFKMTKLKEPSFCEYPPGKNGTQASMVVQTCNMEAEVSLPSVQGELQTPDLSIHLPSSNLEVKAGQVDVKIADVQLPEGEQIAQDADGASLKGHLPNLQMPSFKMPKVDLKGPTVDVKGPTVDAKGPTVDVKSPKAEISGPDMGVSLPGVKVDIQAQGAKLQEDLPHAVTHEATKDSKFKMPKFKMPSFGVSTTGKPSMAATMEVAAPKMEAEVSLPSMEGELQTPDLSIHLPSSHLEGMDPYVDVKIEDAQLADGNHAKQETPGASMKVHLPTVEIPSFKLSKLDLKGATDGIEIPSEVVCGPDVKLLLSGVQADLQTQPSSVVFSIVKVEIDPQIGTCESHQHVSIEKEAEKGRNRKLSFSMPRLALPKIKGSKGRAGMPEGEVKPSLTGTTAGGKLVVVQTSVSDTHVGGTRSRDVATAPSIRSPSMPAEVTGCKTDLAPLEDALDIRGDIQSHMFLGVSASQPFGELTASVTGDLQPSCRQTHSAPTMESPEMDPTAKETTKYSHERRFKMPKFRVPGFRRSSSKERDGAGEQEATQTADAGIALEAEVAAANEPESKLEAHVSLGSPEEGISVETPKSPTYADVVKRDLHGTGVRMHGSTVGMSQTHLSTHELGTHPGKNSSSVIVSELQLPPEGTGKQQHPGSGGHILAEVAAGAGNWPSQPQGPLRLKASVTDMPSQASMVSTSQLWEDSVLTVTFPKLKVPKFSSHDSSSEADVFFPVVRKVQCAEASIDSAMHKDGPGLWVASILKTGAEDPRGPPVSLEQSVEPSPISKVRVHIQGSQGESQEVAFCSRMEQEGSDSSACEAFSTQIVRESEIPVSTIQTPSYGFSLLKVKIPEPSVQASVQTGAPDCQVQEDSVGGAPRAAAGRHFIPADFPPDAGEPFEMISCSAGVPPGPQLTDSTSDEEQAEILEFPEDSQEVKTPEMATKQKPEGKKASLLWSWLPSIGFSSVEETAADSGDAAQRPAPVHVQPAARLDPELPRKQEKAGWFRFPKLGFSSSPTKKIRSAEGGDVQVEQKPQEETLTFFDARESFSPEEEEAEQEVTSARPGSKAMVASSARTELVLLEQARDTGDKSTPRPVAK
ncbi:Protein AHNAK2 [Microtus ochrogaster]|uniref:Protein AHNAK2 n=1 Tax=Microtus ochrogaster TaxID=79684 RepID=A0A8J6GNQ5_MICOH|nr:Protein AHNAK2 [Microtus ochrogaster]